MNKSYIKRLSKSALSVGKPIYKTKEFIRRNFSWLNNSARFQGAFKSRESAVSAVPTHMLVGYNHEPVASVSFDKMCEIALWDYPVMFWLRRLLRESGCVLDAGGHMGTKYRAFRRHLRLEEKKIRWIIYDLPAIVNQGEKRALEEGLNKLEFIDTLSHAPGVDVMLVSGLLQYLDISFPDLVCQMRSLPQHIIVNKVALREEETIFTLENFGVALVPYQIRNRQLFLKEIDEMGYTITDEWEIPSLSHVIPSHSDAGRSQSAGFYLKLKETEA